MRRIGWMKVFAFAGVLAAASIAASPAMAQLTCQTLRAQATFHPYTLGPFSTALNAGDVVTLVDTTVVALGATLNVGSTSQTFTSPGATSITVSASGTYAVSAVGAGPGIPGNATLSCLPGPNVSQVAIVNGLTILQNYQEWITKGVLGSFGLTRGGGTATAPRLDDQPSAQAKLDGLVRRERDLKEELAALPADGERTGEGPALASRLDTTRRDLQYARATATLALSEGSPRRATSGSAHTLGGDARAGEVANARELMRTRQQAVEQHQTAAREQTQTYEGSVGGAPRPAAAAPQLSLDTRDLLDFCAADCAEPAAMSRRWNVWMEGRVLAANDSLLQSNALGFAGSTGVDYKVLPWLATGMSLGVETFETRFGATASRIGTVGISAVPYFGMRLHDSIYASGFAGVTKLNYNTTPSAGVTGSFDALRLFVGGALTGVWHDGPWRFQPSILGAYGSETQNGYTTSRGSSVGGQTVTYGRITVGPEIGYTLKDTARDWSFEPFVLLKGSVDFSSSPSSGALPLRSSTIGSGQFGIGTAMQLSHGFYLRIQGSYDSIGVSGLDVWSGLIRGGITF